MGFAKRQRRWPATAGLGALSFAKGNQGSDDLDECVSPLLTLRVKIVANTLVYGPLALGVVLILWSFKIPGRPEARNANGNDDL